MPFLSSLIPVGNQYCLLDQPTLSLKHLPRFNAGMPFLKYQSDLTRFLKYWDPTTPGEWNAMMLASILINAQVALSNNSFSGYIFLLIISSIKIFWSVILHRLTCTNYMLWYNSSFHRATYEVFSIWWHFSQISINQLVFMHSHVIALWVCDTKVALNVRGSMYVNVLLQLY